MSPGDLIDKASILKIKMRKLGIDLSLQVEHCVGQLSGFNYHPYLEELEMLNERGWEANEHLFKALDQPDPASFGEAIEIIGFVRKAHEVNMARITLKNGINELFGNPEREIKSWQ